MAHVMLVNPRRRKSRSRRKMSAKQAKYFSRNPRRRRKSRRTVSRTRSRRRTMSMVVNPRRRARRSRRRAGFFKRNPLSIGGNSDFMKSLMPAAIGAVGALGVDMALGAIQPNLPEELQSGAAGTALRFGGAIVVGWAAGKVTGSKKIGNEVMAGALVVTIYDMVKSYMTTGDISGTSMSGYNMGWVNPAPSMGAYSGYPDMDQLQDDTYGLGEYVMGQYVS